MARSVGAIILFALAYSAFGTSEEATADSIVPEYTEAAPPTLATELGQSTTAMSLKEHQIDHFLKLIEANETPETLAAFIQSKQAAKEASGSALELLEVGKKPKKKKKTASSAPEFCWRDSYGRGVGGIPFICPEGTEKIGLLCYKTCPAGYYRWGFDCHQYCPDSSDWRDDGLYCRKYEYGRGAGYTYFGTCVADHGQKYSAGSGKQLREVCQQHSDCNTQYCGWIYTSKNDYYLGCCTEAYLIDSYQYCYNLRVGDVCHKNKSCLSRSCNGWDYGKNAYVCDGQDPEDTIYNHLDSNGDRVGKVSGLGCEQNGAMFYPKCREGYSNFGCCICRPPVPDCRALGYNGNLDLSCYKYIIIGQIVPADCAPGEEYDAGLCYYSCETYWNKYYTGQYVRDNNQKDWGLYTQKYDGVGPVCWINFGDYGWKSCGMGALPNTDSCTDIVLGQIGAVGSLIATIATGGAAGAVLKGVKASVKTVKAFKKMVSAVKKVGNGIKTTVKKYKKVKKKVKSVTKKVQKVYDEVSGKETGEKEVEVEKETEEEVEVEDGEVDLEEVAADPDATEEDYARYAAEMASNFDPTGISDVVAAFTYPKCSKYFADGDANDEWE